MAEMNQSTHGGRGRGRGGRNNGAGRGFQRHDRQPPTMQKGLNPLIGAWLDAPPGVSPNPNSTYSWVSKIKDYVGTITDSRIDDVFGINGAVGEYPEYEEPDEPNANASKVEFKIWEIEYSEYRKNEKSLILDLRKTYAIMWGQISESSKNRIRESELGVEAIAEQDPKNLLIAIYGTHMCDSHMGSEENLFRIESLYMGITMTANDTLNGYYQKTNSALSGLFEAHRRAGNDPETKMPEDRQRAIKFILGLSDEYRKLKEFFRNDLKEWPENVSDAFIEAARFVPERKTAFERQIFAAMKGRGRGRGRGRDNNKNNNNNKEKIDIPYGSKPVTCYRCGVQGHYSNECRSDGGQQDIKRAVNEEATKQVK